MFDRTIPFDPDVDMMESEEESGLVRWESPSSFVLSWGARGWGFGMVSFSKRDEGGLYCGDEYMGLDNSKLVLSRFCEKTPQEKWPELLRAYGSADADMADVKAWESQPRDRGKNDAEDRTQ